jgi:hypothetical protein
MALFKCSRCLEVYEDFYPPDDTCLKCKRGLVRIIREVTLSHTQRDTIDTRRKGEAVT